MRRGMKPFEKLGQELVLREASAGRPHSSQRLKASTIWKERPGMGEKGT